jgi:hypothetical protein
MNNGRPTTDKKDCKLKLRLNESMRVWVETQSEYLGISMSEYIRELIKADMNGR